MCRISVQVLSNDRNHIGLSHQLAFLIISDLNQQFNELDAMNDAVPSELT